MNLEKNFFYFLLIYFLFFPFLNTNAQILNRNLKIGDKGQDVFYLQKFLNNDIDTVVSESGPGSFGLETDYFGLLTEDAVKRFQEKYRDDVLIPAGVISPTGFVGQYTIRKINELYLLNTNENNAEVKKEEKSNLNSENPQSLNISNLYLNQGSQNSAFYGNIIPKNQAEIDKMNQDYLNNAKNGIYDSDLAIVFVSPSIPREGQEIRVYATKIDEPFEFYVSGQRVNSVKIDNQKGFYYFNLPNVQSGQNTIWIEKDGKKSNDFQINIISKNSKPPIVSSVPTKIYFGVENVVKGSNFGKDITIKTSFGNFKPTKQGSNEITFIPTLMFPSDKSFEQEGILIVSDENGDADTKLTKFVYEKN